MVGLTGVISHQYPKKSQKGNYVAKKKVKKVVRRLKSGQIAKKKVKKKARPHPGFKVVTGDCVKKLKTLSPNCVNLVVADPPYNINYKAYDKYDDKLPDLSYLYWMAEWMAEIHRVLHATGSFWLAINDEYVAPAEMIATQHPLLLNIKQGLGNMARFPKFYLRSHVVWYYTFGVATQKNFARSHTHWLYFTKHKKNFYYDKDAARVPSMRQLTYNDKRAKKGGKQPDNTWILTPDALAKCFGPDHDTWLASRVCGTFGERQHRGTYKETKGVPQMPEEIMDRIIRPCVAPRGVVIDPFLGTGTTGVSAVRHGCEFWGCDLSGNYVARSKKRIQAAMP